MTDLLPSLADACRRSGLRVVELPRWENNFSGGAFDPDGVDCHHTGSYDSIADKDNDYDYALWLAFEGRDVSGDGVSDPPLCNLALSAEGVVYVCAAGNANHAGAARATGPMPAASDGNALYIGIEAMNSGTQGWGSVGVDADGETVTQYHAYARLCAALCVHYGWPASHVRAHKETSLTGKWDPGGIEMDDFRQLVAHYMEEMDMPSPKDIANAVWNEDIRVGTEQIRAGRLLAQIRNRVELAPELKQITGKLRDLEDNIFDAATRDQVRRVREDLRGVTDRLDAAAASEVVADE